MSVTPPPLEDTLITSYKRLAQESAGRDKDLVLRILDVVFAGLLLAGDLPA